MKKILFTVFIAASIFTSAFAKDKNMISGKVAYAFESEFQDATDINWTSHPTFTKASFVLDGKKMDAFYDLSGEIIGTTNQSDFQALSQKAKQKIAKKYAAYTIREVVSFQCDAENCYYVSADNGVQKLILKVKNGMVTVFQKTKMK